MKAVLKTALKTVVLMTALSQADTVTAIPEYREPVVLLHGLARSASSMQKMEAALQLAGYRTCNIAYPSRQHDVATLAKDHIAPALQRCFPDYEGPLHFVTHSMGGILVRQLALDSQYEKRIGRVVMMGTPNHGSEVIDHLGTWPLFKRIAGPAGPQLSTAPDSLPQTLGPINFEVGIIAGNFSFNPFLSLLLPGADDGKVSVTSTQLEGMQDFIVLRSSHVFIMRNRQAIESTVRFLESGSFNPLS
ncbi:MAG: esterase/lipase family protein [Moraxellaceae bacterium]